MTVNFFYMYRAHVQPLKLIYRDSNSKMQTVPPSVAEHNHNDGSHQNTEMLQ